MTERTDANPAYTKPILPLRLRIGALSVTLIAASYPVALIDDALIIGGYIVPAFALRVLLYTLLHVAGLAGTGLAVNLCERELLRRTTAELVRSVPRRQRESAAD